MKKAIREKAILTGLYLSKFDKVGLEALGFSGFVEAYNTLGYSLGVKPASLKNYRDEFDPQFPNDRKGRRNRPMRDYCKKIYNEYSELGLLSFQNLLKSFLVKDYDIEEIVEKSRDIKDYSETFAKRLATGIAAEEYFKTNYRQVDVFKQFELKDTTNLGCGFDFKVFNNSGFYCVEVKGLSNSSGSISLTEKEFRMAKSYSSQFCLFIVKNFKETPHHEFIFDPLNSRLSFVRSEKQITQINFNATI